MKDPDKLKLMLLAWNYNLQAAQVQAANAALSPNNSSTTTATTVGTPVTSQSAISTANNTINNSTLTGNTLFHWPTYAALSVSPRCPKSCVLRRGKH